MHGFFNCLPVQFGPVLLAVSNEIAGILYEDGIEMARWGSAGDFISLDEKDFPMGGTLPGNLVGSVVVGRAQAGLSARREWGRPPRVLRLRQQTTNSRTTPVARPNV